MHASRPRLFILVAVRTVAVLAIAGAAAFGARAQAPQTPVGTSTPRAPGANHPQEANLVRQAATALGFVALLGGIALLLVRRRGGMPWPSPAGAGQRIRLLDSRRAGGTILVLAEVDGERLLIATSGAAIGIVRLGGGT